MSYFINLFLGHLSLDYNRIRQKILVSFHFLLPSIKCLSNKFEEAFIYVKMLRLCPFLSVSIVHVFIQSVTNKVLLVLKYPH